MPLILLAILLIAGGVIYYFSRQTPPENGNEEVYCTQDAKLCTDGSYVGRIGPECKFDACPGASKTEDGVSFSYPTKIWTSYVSTVDWPPAVEVTDGPFTCTEAGQENGRAGVTEKKTIEGKEFCVTHVNEGAAGSVYTQYAYATELNSKVVTLTFSLRRPQCANYDEPTKSTCESEQSAFDVDGMMGEIAQTLKME